MAVKIEDIAKLANVSSATVSRVINYPQLVSQKTRAKVQALISQYDFKPNLYARALMRAKTGTVGILVPFIANQYHMEIIDSIETELNARGIKMLLCNTQDSAELEKIYFKDLVSRNVDAIIAVETASINSDKYNNFKDLAVDIPLILVNEHTHTKSNCHIVRCEQETGLKECAQHIITHNLFPLTIVLGNIKTAWSFLLKKTFFEAEFVKHNINPSLYSFVYIDNPNNEKNIKETVNLAVNYKKKGKLPRCFFAGNDLMAVGLLQGLLISGVRVPKEVSVIGVDNTLMSRISVPEITTIDLCCRKLGSEIVHLLEELENSPKNAIIRRTIGSKLIIRESA